MPPPVITSWLRDYPALKMVQSEMREAPPTTPLRAASIGCATGEEAYGLAYLIRQNGQQGRVFGYDIDRQALEQAKSATYQPTNSNWDAPEIPREEMFEQSESGQQVVRRELRDMVEFSDKDFLKDQTIGSGEEQFDVVSCRNLLQHFAVEPQLLETAVSRFAEMTKDNGILLLDKKAIETMIFKSPAALRLLDKHFTLVSPDNPKIWRKKLEVAP